MWLKGFQAGTAPLPALREAALHILELFYGELKREWQTREKYARNAEIYRRYLNGDDSVVLAQAYNLSDRRVRSIIDQERKHNLMDDEGNETKG